MIQVQRALFLRDLCMLRAFRDSITVWFSSSRLEIVLHLRGHLDMEISGDIFGYNWSGVELNVDA